MVAQRKEKVVFSAEPRQARAIEELVRQGRYQSASEFLREAVDQRLASLRLSRLEEQLDQYCELGFAEEDSVLIDAQAWGEDE